MSLPSWYFDGDTLILNLRVQPRATRDEVTGMRAGRIKLRISAPPVEDAASERLKAFLANEFGISRGRVRTVAGETQRQKRVALDGPKRLPDWLRKSK